MLIGSGDRELIVIHIYARKVMHPIRECDMVVIHEKIVQAAAPTSRYEVVDMFFLAPLVTVSVPVHDHIHIVFFVNGDEVVLDTLVAVVVGPEFSEGRMVRIDESPSRGSAQAISQGFKQEIVLSRSWREIPVRVKSDEVGVGPSE